MDSALAMASSSFLLHQKSIPNFSTLAMSMTSSKPFLKPRTLSIKASSKSSSASSFASHLKATAATLVFSAAVFGKFHLLPARADPPPPPTVESEIEGIAQVEEVEEGSTPLKKFLESSTESIEAMKTFLEEKLEGGEDELALKVLKKLCSAQPDNMDWKFLAARVLSEMGNTEEARKVFEEVLSKNPLSFSALFENALLMDKCGKGEEVIKRLEDALKIAEEENKADAVRDIRLIIAQVQFLQTNVEEALRSYEELEKEDPADFRPSFCKGVIYSLMDKNEEAREQFAKFRKLSPKGFDVEGFLRSSLSRMKLFETDEGEN